MWLTRAMLGLQTTLQVQWSISMVSRKLQLLGTSHVNNSIASVFSHTQLTVTTFFWF